MRYKLLSDKPLNGMEAMQREYERMGKPISRQEHITCRAILAIAGCKIDKEGYIQLSHDLSLDT